MISKLFVKISKEVEGFRRELTGVEGVCSKKQEAWVDFCPSILVGCFQWTIGNTSARWPSCTKEQLSCLVNRLRNHEVFICFVSFESGDFVKLMQIVT